MIVNDFKKVRNINFNVKIFQFLPLIIAALIQLWGLSYLKFLGFNLSLVLYTDFLAGALLVGYKQCASYIS